MNITNVSNNFVFEYENFGDELIEQYVGYWRKFVGVWELITGLIGAPANALVALISCLLIRNNNSRANNHNTVYRNHHLCVLSMAVSDLIFCAGHCPIMFAHYALLAELDHFGCRYMYFMTHCSTVASSVSLFLLNMDKFICIRYPIKYYIIYSRERAEMLIVGGWLLSICWSSFFIFGPLADGFNESCKVYVYEPYVYYVAFVVTFFVLPITLSLFISIYVFVEAIKARHCKMNISELRLLRQYSVMELRRCRRSKPTSLASSMTTSTLNSNKSSPTSTTNVRWKLKSVTFVFITTLWSSLTCLPYRSSYLAFHFYPQTWLAKLAFILFAIMIANAAGNPFITMLTQKQYRDKAKKFLKYFGRRLSSKSEKENRRRCATLPAIDRSPTLIRMRAKTF